MDQSWSQRYGTSRPPSRLPIKSVCILRDFSALASCRLASLRWQPCRSGLFASCPMGLLSEPYVPSACRYVGRASGNHQLWSCGSPAGLRSSSVRSWACFTRLVIAFAEKVARGNNLRSYSFKFTAWMPGTALMLKRCHQLIDCQDTKDGKMKTHSVILVAATLLKAEARLPRFHRHHLRLGDTRRRRIHASDVRLGRSNPAHCCGLCRN